MALREAGCVGLVGIDQILLDGGWRHGVWLMGSTARRNLEIFHQVFIKHWGGKCNGGSLKACYYIPLFI